jgi:hypothetical protein
MPIEQVVSFAHQIASGLAAAHAAGIIKRRAVNQKRHVLFDAGHGPLLRGQVINESLSWLDTHLGPPD